MLRKYTLLRGKGHNVGNSLLNGSEKHNIHMYVYAHAGVEDDKTNVQNVNSW